MKFDYPSETYNTQSAEQILPIVFSLIGTPESVLDVGCGNGSWLKVLEKMNIKEYQGIDADYVNPDGFLVNYNKHFQPIDLSKSFNLNKNYDLIISLEVAEHIPAECADIFVENLVKHGDTILFSAAIPFQGGFKHINEQYPTYWAEKFAKHHYYFYDLVRPLIWYNQNIQVWYKQNIFLIGNEASVLARNFQTTPILNLVHPVLFEEKARQAQRVEQMENGKLGLRIALNSFLKAFKYTIWKKLKNPLFP